MSQPSTIVVNGKTYQYDYDFDCYYRCHDQTPESVRTRLIKITGAILLLFAIMLFAKFFLHQ
jgi:hypothetical protein